jgi:phenylacetate-CoA ligase
MHDDTALLRKQLQSVYSRSALYRRKWRGAIDSEADLARIASTRDLPLLPFTLKDELRVSQQEVPPLGLHLGVPEGDIRRISSTSGTTGRPLYYALTERDKLVVWESWRNVFTAAGLGGDDLTIFGLTMGGPYGALYGAEALEWSGHASIPAGSQVSSARFLQLLQDLRPTAVISITNFPLRLAEVLREKRIEPRDIGVKKFIVAGEPIKGVRDLIQDTWGAKVFDMMGIGEAGMLWAECEHRAGMHFIADGIVHMEYVDPDSLEPVSLEEGRVAELVFTHLRRDACPLVRYRTHDLARITAVGCTCGRPGPRIEPIGRSDDMIKVRGASIFPSAIESLIVAFGEPLSENFRVVLPRGERKFSTPLKLVIGLAQPVEAEAQPALAEKVGAYLRDSLNARTEVSFVPAKELSAQVKGPMDRRNYFVDGE